MGIRGLESFIYSLYKSGRMLKKRLDQIKFVIDGNAIPHIICRELDTNNNWINNIWWVIFKIITLFQLLSNNYFNLYI